MMVAAIGFLLSYFMQSKGWPYHALPLLGCSSIGVAAWLANTKTPPRLLRLAAPTLLLMPFVIAVQATLREPLPNADVRRAIAGLRPGESVGFIATDPALPWSVTYQSDLRYPSRYMSFWMMRAVISNEALGGPDRRLTELGRRVVGETVADFRCNPPRRIIVARPRPGVSPREAFDILPFFLRDPQFAALMAHYRPVQRTTLEVYEVESPPRSMAAPTAGCVFRVS
jgi:hypothetical protein